MQRTAEFHHHIPAPLLPQAHPVFDDTAALDTTINMLDPQPTLVPRLVGHVLLQRELLAAWLLGRPEALHLWERERQEAEILSQPAPGGQGRGHRVGNAFVVDAAAGGVAQKEEQEEGMDEPDSFDHVVLFRVVSL